MLKLKLNGIVIIVGNCGSGKTEVSVNLALNQISRGIQVKIADLDLVNPYFRAREVRHCLLNHGIRMILPPKQYLNADLPILTPAIAGMIESSPELLILDVGGDGIGSTVLGALSSFLEDKNVTVLYVINPNRPYTSNIQDCLKIRDEIEASAKIKITGIVGNANLMKETSSSEIYKGYDFVIKLSEIMHVPLCFITAPAKKMANLILDNFKCPVLPIWRQLVPPWICSELINN